MSEEGDQEGLVQAVPDLVEQSRWVIPFAVGLDKLDLMTKACYQLNADKEPVEATKIASATNIHINTTRPNLDFLVSIGILSTDKNKKAYSLTPKGKEYVSHLKSNELPDAARILKELLPSSHLKEVLDYLELHQGSNDLTYDNVFDKIKTLARIREDANGAINNTYRAGVRCLIGLLGRAGYIPSGILQQTDAGRNVAQGTKKQSRSQREPITSSSKDDIVKKNGTQKENSSVETNTPFVVNITIEARDAESIKQVIELVKLLRGQGVDIKTED